MAHQALDESILQTPCENHRSFRVSWHTLIYALLSNIMATTLVIVSGEIHHQTSKLDLYVSKTSFYMNPLTKRYTQISYIYRFPNEEGITVR